MGNVKEDGMTELIKKVGGWCGLLGFMIALLCTAAGCDMGTYEKRYQEQRNQLR
ncbi:MAG TPA: hypothetical protein PKD54_14720 [Pirellulaceae bacterium]|nr:hypothetical protein [Pirellulaceae bacterium]